MADKSGKGDGQQELDRAIRDLIDVCNENKVDVPDELNEELKNLSVRSKEDEKESSHKESHKELLDECHSKWSVASTEEMKVIAEFKEANEKLKSKLPDFDVRVRDGSYIVTNYVEVKKKKENDSDEEEGGGSRHAKQKIKTVKTEGFWYKIYKVMKNCIVNKGYVPPTKKEVVIMEDVNLVFETGKMYLVLGAPGSGKSTLLRLIADKLFETKNHVAGGNVSIAGISPGKNVYWPKLVAYIDQIDRLHSYLTVGETFNFAWKCRTGGTHRKVQYGDDAEVDEAVKELDEKNYVVNAMLDAVGLTRVSNTFVGDQERVRGVSGGEKKRVTVGEMYVAGTPVVCCDEISTGLDAATTFDITRVLGAVTRMTKKIHIISLLQPPPETVALFDEIILLSEGKIIYSGPMDEVIDYFCNLGYEIPERMDMADWLQALPTSDGWQYLKGASEDGATKKDLIGHHLSTDEFHEKFCASEKGMAIMEKLESPVKAEGDESLTAMASKKYELPWYKSLKMVTSREVLLWWRDKYQIKAKAFQTLFMGTIVGTLFFQSTDNPNNVVSICFQSLFYILLQAMVLLMRQFPDRSIFYKQQDADFFPTWTYVVGRSLASIPNALIDAIVYGSMIFWLVGLAYNDGATVGNYFLFMLLLFTTSLTAGLVYSIFSSSVRDITTAQVCNSITSVFVVLFSGFTVQPDVIPNYWIWAYWLNCFAWLLRGLVLNEFQSGKYDDIVGDTGMTEGEVILTEFGFTRNGEPFTFVWIWYGILFSFGCAFLTLMCSTFCLNHVRFATGQSLVTDQGSDEIEEMDEADMVEIPFKRVDLTFKDVRYVVTASTSNEKLELLQGIDGVVEAGRMTALMGSSGAGKTTLMDVLALRKSSGEISGDVRLNGHPQEEQSFRRCAGYVEQFDVQSPQLTIRETIKFSAKLRLDESDPAVTPENINKFVDQTMYMLELTNLQDLQVGTDETGGLSFEQRKRLSIAVEVAANPSIIFLDEPTSGLDARAAAIVMRGMKRIALSGRAVCATIHQPSVAIFNDFDSLLLLKRGGEVIYFGDVGTESSNLIQYLESYSATPKIKPGENPATWMLTTIGAGSAASTEKPFDYAGNYVSSKLHDHCLEKIDAICAGASEENKVTFTSMYATSRRTQSITVLRREMTVYWRSPSYNMTRLMVSGILALLFASVYASQRVPQNESDMNSRINSIYIAVLFLCVNAQNTVLKVYEVERNMFYRHKAANMYNTRALINAFTLAEAPFIALTGMVFMICFYFIMGFAIDAGKFFLFYMFVAFGLAVFTFGGQMWVSLLRDSQTAQGIGGIFMALTSLFSGILIRPAEIPTFWIFMYWIMPGHWIFEGLIMSQYRGDNTEIEANPGSAFYQFLVATGQCDPETDEPCEGTAWEWVQVSFQDWSADNIRWDALYLICIIILFRIIAFVALATLNYRAT